MSRRVFYTVAFNIDNAPEGFDPEGLEAFMTNVILQGLDKFKDHGAILMGGQPNEVTVSFDIEREPFKPV